MLSATPQRVSSVRTSINASGKVSKVKNNEKEPSKRKSFRNAPHPTPKSNKEGPSVRKSSQKDPRLTSKSNKEEHTVKKSYQNAPNLTPKSNKEEHTLKKSYQNSTHLTSKSNKKQPLKASDDDSSESKSSSEKATYQKLAKIFRSNVQELDVDEHEMVTLLLSVDQRTRDGMLSFLTETLSRSYRFESIVHKVSSVLIKRCHREGSHLKILFPLLKKSKVLSDSIIILLLSTMVHFPSLKPAIWEGISSLGLLDPRKILLSFLSRIQPEKKTPSKKVQRKLRVWLTAWKHHFDKNVCSIIEKIQVEKSSAFGIGNFLLRKIELVADAKYLRGSLQMGLPITHVPTKGDLKNNFTRDRLVEENFSTVVVTLLEDVLEDPRFEIKPIEILNYFAETVGKEFETERRVVGVMDAFERYSPPSFVLTDWFDSSGEYNGGQYTRD